MQDHARKLDSSEEFRKAASREKQAGKKKRPKPQRSKKRREEMLVIAGFLAPALLIYGVYVVYSIVMTFYYSLFEWSGIDNNMVFTGLQNYITLLSDGVFWTSFQNNFLLVGASLLTQLPLGLIMALLII